MKQRSSFVVVHSFLSVVAGRAVPGDKDVVWFQHSNQCHSCNVQLTNSSQHSARTPM